MLEDAGDDPLGATTPQKSSKKALTDLEKEMLILDKDMEAGKAGKANKPQQKTQPPAKPPAQRLPAPPRKIAPSPSPKPSPAPPEPEKKRELNDLSEDEWIDRGKFYGESPVLECDIMLQCPDKSFEHGTLSLTNYQLYFYSEKNRRFDGHFAIPVTQVAKMSMKKKNMGSKEACILELLTRDFREIKFMFVNDKAHGKRTNITPDRVALMLQKMCFPDRMTYLFAFDYARKRDLPWRTYDNVAEYRRMGIGDVAGADKKFRVSTINRKYQFCETYPSHLVFPSVIDDKTILSVGEFRRRERVPALTWKRPGSDACIYRCSQPKVGFGSTSKDDVLMLEALLKSNLTSKNDKLYILDCRPWKNAVANKVQGAGWENATQYPFCSVEFLDIENIHVMYKSRMKLGQAIHNMKKGQIGDIDVPWLEQLSGTDWMYHTRTILKGTAAVVKRIRAGESVLVHCSDGWDRTSQICALAEICLDPYYRTIDGFITLIQKDWLDFGHQFNTRGGFGKMDEQNSKRSPVFEQYIDTIWQLTEQFPSAFEYTSDFLSALLHLYFSCRFGTFLYNCPKERLMHEVHKKTACMWDCLLNWHRDRASFKNPFYVPEGGILEPMYNTRVLKFWTQYYLAHAPERYCKGDNPLSDFKPHNLLLQDEVLRLREQVEALKVALTSRNPEPEPAQVQLEDDAEKKEHPAEDEAPLTIDES